MKISVEAMKKFLILFLLIYSVVHVISVKSVISVGIAQIIRNFYARNYERFDFIIYKSDTTRLNDIVNDILKVKDMTPCKVSVVGKKEKRVELFNSAILMFDSFKHYAEFHKTVQFKNEYRKVFHNLVYIDESFDERHFEQMERSDAFAFDNFVYQDQKNSASLVTFMTYQLQPLAAGYNKHFSKVESKMEEIKVFRGKISKFQRM